MKKLDYARRVWERAQDSLGKALLRPEIRNACSISGVDGRAWDALYYRRNEKSIAAFRKAFPAIAETIATELNDIVSTWAFYLEVRAEEKRALEARRAARARKESLGSRPDPIVNPIAAANYAKLVWVFEAEGDAYVTRYAAACERAVAGRVVRFIEAEARNEGREVFNAYLSKLALKITVPIDDARLAGSLWSGSTLTINAGPNGTNHAAQVWNTRTILNCSCLGKLFNQWPTRRVK